MTRPPYDSLPHDLAYDVFVAAVDLIARPSIHDWRRLAFVSETMNSIAQIFGLRNGMVTALPVPRAFARTLRRLDSALTVVDEVLCVDPGRAWFTMHSGYVCTCGVSSVCRLHAPPRCA